MSFRRLLIDFLGEQEFRLKKKKKRKKVTLPAHWAADLRYLLIHAGSAAERETLSRERDNGAKSNGRH